MIDDVDGLTALVLCNALYFKGNWAVPFDVKDTFDMDFIVDAQTVKKVPTMSKKSSELNNGYLTELSAKFIELPYEVNAYPDIVAQIDSFLVKFAFLLI